MTLLHKQQEWCSSTMLYINISPETVEVTFTIMQATSTAASAAGLRHSNCSWSPH